MEQSFWRKKPLFYIDRLAEKARDEGGSGIHESRWAHPEMNMEKESGPDSM